MSYLFLQTSIIYIFCAVLSLSVVSDSLQSHGWQPARLLCPWDSPGKNTGVGCHALIQGIFPAQGSNSGLPRCRQIHQGSQRILEYVAYPFFRGTSHPRNQTRVSCIAVGLFTSWATRAAHIYMYIYIHTHTLHILSHYGLSRILNIVPCSIYRTLLFSHPIYNSLHLLIPISLHFLIRLSWIINLLEMPGGGGEVFIDCNYWVGQKSHSGWFNGKMWTNLLAKPTFFNK